MQKTTNIEIDSQSALVSLVVYKAITLTLCVRKSLCSDFPLNQHSEECQDRPHPHDHPSKPAHWLLGIHLQKIQFQCQLYP